MKRYVGISTLLGFLFFTILHADAVTSVSTLKGLHFHPLIKEADTFDDAVFGRVYDVKGNVLTDVHGGKDANMLFVYDDKAYLLTHIETTPGALYLTTIEKKGETLVAVGTKNIDLSSVGGIVSPCAASKTPWNTHLGGEEDYDFNSIYFDPKSPFYKACQSELSDYCTDLARMKVYLQGRRFTPYDHGSTFEVQVDKKGQTHVVKHHITGKYTPELALVMPDQKTVYITDDGEDKGLYKFVSSTKIEGFDTNWKGTLFMARVHQTSEKDGGSFDVSWVELGSSSDDEVKALIEQEPQVSDIFDLKKSRECRDGFTSIREDGNRYCVRLKVGKARSKRFADDKAVKTAAAFLETRKYGAYLGATTEFRKEEGLAYDPKHNALYLSMTQINKSMTKNYKKDEPNEHVRLEENVCGAVYRLSLDQTFSATKMEAILVGRPLSINEKGAKTNACDPLAIANPDNLLFADDKTLFIAEDSDVHLNNILWSHDLISKRITQVASLPTGAEVAGMVRAKVFGKELLFFNVQHPFKTLIKNAKGEVVNQKYIDDASIEDKKGFVGYIDDLDKVLLH